MKLVLRKNAIASQRKLQIRNYTVANASLDLFTWAWWERTELLCLLNVLITLPISSSESERAVGIHCMSRAREKGSELILDKLTQSLGNHGNTTWQNELVCTEKLGVLICSGLVFHVFFCYTSVGLSDRNEFQEFHSPELKKWGERDR